jgi:hypothetical protein
VQVMADIHAAGWAWRDCTPANFSVRKIIKCEHCISRESSLNLSSEARFYFSAHLRYSNEVFVGAFRLRVGAAALA